MNNSAYQINKGINKPLVMKQLKQILQLKSDSIAIWEIASCIDISRNSVRKYLALLVTDTGALSNTDLVDMANKNNLLEHDAHLITITPNLHKGSQVSGRHFLSTNFL